MLNQETKRRIDSARDILVGKVPDPKAQVEQITTALIYKFMDDMDKESEELGGKARFFVNEYEKYSWSKLLDTRLGGFERLNLYTEALLKMPQNPNLPQLFRNILKDAFLPYRDPETLNLFLKEINGFTYEHSEKLGDAFEYLLSVMDSQGDAGQFRTPRHIIDFIVEVVDPKKDETILDPACGTAGFLISSYKHILKQNTIHQLGDQLTPDEKTKLMNHFMGYDISPDMVRLSLVNMYLHGFPNPNVFEYDTLTSEERWDETYDVIMANPPFMSPKGGIRPHKRFSTQANRSEVLFVDYIAEHLTTHGRAGVIVPEGIIFQSGNAYKALRKMLVEKYLFAVVSLPAGIFQPYSGVKTCILLMDNQSAKKANSVLFVKVENDGFDLGAQRRAIEKNDLTEALCILQKYKQALNENTNVQDMFLDKEEATLATVVEKAKIAKNGDYNLLGERYKESIVKQHQKWPMVDFNNVCTLEYGAALPDRNRVPGEFPVVGSNGITGWHNDFLIKGPAIIVGRKGSAGEVVWVDKNCFPIDTTYYVMPVLGVEIDKRYLYYVLKDMNLTELRGGGAVPGLNRNDVYESKQIPIPPLEVQQEIVAELDSYQKIIDGAKQVKENYKPSIKIDPSWEMAELERLIEFISGLTLSIPDCADVEGTPIISINNVTEEGSISFNGLRKIKLPDKKSINFLQKGDLLFNWRNGSKHLVGKTAYFDLDGEYVFASFLLGIRVHKTKLLSKYLWYVLNWYRRDGKYMQFMRQNVNGLFNREELKIVKIPLPSLEIQEQIVSQLQEEQKLVEANKKLIEIFEQKIKDKIAEVWGD